MKNRTVIGIICIGLALVVTFVVAPIVNRLADSKTEIVRITNNVTQGHVITEDDIEVVSVGAYNLPSDIITEKESVVGRFAATDLKVGDYLMPSKILTESSNAADVFKTLDGTKQAISITIGNFSEGLSGKLQNGDIISLIVYNGSSGKAVKPASLTYIKVITTTTADGLDKDELVQNEDGSYDLPATITLLVNSYQAKKLVEYENSGVIHAELVYRGNSDTAQKLLDLQDEYFENLTEAELEKNDGIENGSTGENDIVEIAGSIVSGNEDYYLPGKNDGKDDTNE